MDSFFDFFDNQYIWNVVVSIFCGALIGFEREYRNKSAGFRTIVLICFGSAVFTVVSRMIGGNGNDDRIAANIVTGIGFIGAGVIFKGKLSVKGLTTSAVIWSTAGVGMIAGIGETKLALFFTIFMVIILSLFQQIEQLLSRYYLIRTVHVRFATCDFDQISNFEQEATKFNVKFSRKTIEKLDGGLAIIYDLSGKMENINKFNERLIYIPEVKEFYYN
ncbi:MgtC/SapB family protein [Sphingobacterium sp. SRCM116780]|uniref:MgtC/SapB family protein n=1 Tax=Sphingobacterium sp. SRCM116780 TaxID=2907623 RepID=UPI001F2D744E|nr:MgtC/SapB family protein [Sphingobacterium sp. SRCM116780]UIR57657.1 MgtC/SapB family protein [Sphingobacterium sp. SRCM116780]